MSGETFVIDQSIPLEERCTPVTLACLEAQPEWNPTMATTGIERIDPSELVLLKDSYPLSSVEGFWSQPFEFVVVENVFTNESCTQFPEYLDYFEEWTNNRIKAGDGIPSDNPRRDMRCPPYGPEVYTELAIFSSQTNEFFHAF